MFNLEIAEYLMKRGHKVRATGWDRGSVCRRAVCGFITKKMYAFYDKEKNTFAVMREGWEEIHYPSNHSFKGVPDGTIIGYDDWEIYDPDNKGITSEEWIEIQTELIQKYGYT